MRAHVGTHVGTPVRSYMSLFVVRLRELYVEAKNYFMYIMNLDYLYTRSNTYEYSRH